MENLVPLGTGNSRFMKSNISPSTTLAQLIQMLNNGTFPYDVGTINPAGISQQGDPINKDTLLKDATAALYGLGSDAVPDDVLAYLGQYSQYWWKRTSISDYSPVIGTTSVQVVAEGGMSGVDTVYCSGTISISSTGIITLDNPVSCGPGTGNEPTVLRGKYFTTTRSGMSGVFYAATDAEAYVSGGSPLYWNVECGQVTAQQTSEPVDYVHSSDRDAYPDSGESGNYTYQFLGVPFDNAVEAPKIETGSYVGTGTYGASNPNTLTFDFEPKVVFIQGTSLSNYSGYFGGCFVKNTSAGPVFMSTENNNNQGAYWAVMTEWDGKSFAYYSKVSNAYQMNLSGGTYTYLAIG